MALSATMPLHVQGFIHTSLRFPPKCPLLKRSVDRQNICYIIREMTYPARSFQDLFFLLPQNTTCASDIVKTMVFVDGLGEACDLTSALIERIPKSLYEEEPDLVAEYTNGLTAERRDYCMDLFQKGICRILVCTEACGMGVDIADVERVIQWGVTSRVNLSTIVQRMGRAARKSHMQGVGMLFHSSHSLITEKHVAEAQKYLRPATHLEYAEVQNDIRRYDLGFEDKARSLKRRRIKDFPKHCRATLSLINTPECRRHVILSYFGETPAGNNPICCDYCLGPTLSLDLRRLVPPQVVSQREVSGALTGQTPTPKHPKVPPNKQQKMIEEIKIQRQKIWRSLGGNKRFSPYAASALIREKDIMLLTSKSMLITTPDHVPKTLGLLSHQYISPSQHQLWANTFDIINSTLRDPNISDTLPEPSISEQSNNRPTHTSSNHTSSNPPPNTAL